VNDAENNLRNMINRINRQKLEHKNIRLTLRKQCSTSWLEFELPLNRDSVKASEKTNINDKAEKRVSVVEDEEN